MWRNLLLNNYTISGASQVNLAGSINAVDNVTSSTGNFVATAGMLTASSGTIGGTTGSFDTLAKPGTSTWKPLTSTSRGVCIGLVIIASGGLDIVADTNQYSDFTTTNTDYTGRITYISTKNYSEMQVNGSLAPSLNIK